MLKKSTTIEKFETKGEKTGWRYVHIERREAEQIKPQERRSIRVKGRIDQVEISGMSLIPMGEGDFILALSKPLRVKLKKEEGDPVYLELEHDANFTIEMPEDLELCLLEEENLFEEFMNLSKSHRNYFINWLNTAKTEATRLKRLVAIVDAMDRKLDFGAMIRGMRKTS